MIRRFIYLINWPECGQARKKTVSRRDVEILSSRFRNFLRLTGTVLTKIDKDDSNT